MSTHFEDIPRPGPDYVTLGDLLRDRGWSRSMIDSILGPADKFAVNPHGYKSPMHLYARDRVTAAELGPAYLQGRAKALARSKAKQRAGGTERRTS